MARGKQGILGALSGRVANVVCSSWKGIAVFKSLPASVANPRTAAQIQQRTAMAFIVQVAVKINTSVIKPLWDRFQTQKSGFNAFVQTNIALFKNGWLTEPQSFVISIGKMNAPVINSTSFNPLSHIISIGFDTNLTDAYAQHSDIAFAAVLNVSKQEASAVFNVATRVAGNIILSVPDSFGPEDEMYVYLAFRRADGTVVSNTGMLHVA